MKPFIYTLLIATAMVGQNLAQAAIEAAKVTTDLSRKDIADTLWTDAKVERVSLVGQPMAVPRQKTTTTAQMTVQAVHDGKWIAFRLQWDDPEQSDAGQLGKYSDAVAIQFPVKEGSPPPIFMGAKDQPVHIFHWRAQYQIDRDRGQPTMKDLYPNMNPDMYPMEFKDSGSVKGLTDEMREAYSHGRAAGNPQSSRKVNGLDEIFAEGFGTSAVAPASNSWADGKWAAGKWTVVVGRALKKENGSTLEPGKQGFAGFAIWQGGKDEVGGRKSVTMSWTPVQLKN